MSFAAEKALVQAHYAALARATPETVSTVLAERTTAEWHWRGMHPFHEQTGAAAVAAAFWAPFLRALQPVQRREDIFIAGRNEIDGFASPWVVSMGHLMGLFDEPWLGIRPTRQLTMLRYAEFNRVEGGKIVETAFFCDIPHVMIQAGQNPFPPQTAAHLVQPGPLGGGVLLGPTNPAEGEATLAAINAMINDLKTWQQGEPIERELARSWTDDMIWWGPAGIGATYTIARYAEQHAQPFRAGFKDRQFNGHVCRLAEGHFGGFFGWANLTLTPVGGFMGLPGADTPSEMRVVDIYRREGDKLAENWVFIDLLHYLNLLGVDVLARQNATH